MTLLEQSKYLTNHIWRTSNKTELLISSMSSQHLLSSYCKCIRGNWRLPFVPLILAELATRGYRTSHPEIFI